MSFSLVCQMSHKKKSVKGEQAKVLNQMIEEWIDISEKNSPFLQNMHLKEMVGHTPLQVMAGMVVGIVVGCLYPMHLL